MIMVVKNPHLYWLNATDNIWNKNKRKKYLPNDGIHKTNVKGMWDNMNHKNVGEMDERERESDIAV